jgi:hypothetical protein
MEDYRYKTWSNSPFIGQEIQSCTSDATRCYSTLAMAPSFIELNKSNGSPQPCIVLAPSQETLYFKLKTVEELRKTVAARAARISLIWSVVMLLVSECSLGNVQEQRVHLKGLSQLLDSIQDQAYPPKPKNCLRTLNKRFESPLKRNLFPVEMLDTFRDRLGDDPCWIDPGSDQSGLPRIDPGSIQDRSLASRPVEIAHP